MKFRLLTIFALAFILFAPLAASATQCCTSTGKPISTPSVGIIGYETLCEIKRGACASGAKEVDCNSIDACKALIPVCCAYKFPPGSSTKNFCHENSIDKNFACESFLTPGMTFSKQNSFCSDVPDCAGANILKNEKPSAPEETPKAPTYEIIKPKLSINIPTLNMPDFLQVEQKDGYVYIPFIAVYLAAAYKLGVGVAAILAIIMIMAGGFIWTLSAGDAGKISKAKSMISSAIIGLILAVGSYTVLQLINPDLVSFKSLKVKVVTPQELDVFDKGDEQFSADLSKTDLDNVFKAYAACYGIDWRVLKGVAAVESGLDPTRPNKRFPQYQGLFQENSSYCNTHLKGFSFLSCANLFDAEANTAAAAQGISGSIKEINSKCPELDIESQMFLLYTGHNNGPAVMDYVLANKACAKSAQLQYVRQFYDTCGGKNPVPADCNGKFRTVDADWGKRKWEKGQTLANNVKSMGATSALAATDKSICPSTTGKRVVELTP